MPISRGELESTLERPAYLILGFLRARIDAAYTAREIAVELIEAGRALDEGTLERALTELTSRQWVETSNREGEIYYAYRRWIGFRR